MTAAKEIQALKQELAEIKQRLKRLELFAGDVSRDAWARVKRDVDSGGEAKVAGPNLPALPVRTELNNIGGATI